MLYFDTLIPFNIEVHFFPSLSTRQNIYFLIATEEYSGISQIFKIELFVNIGNDLKPLVVLIDRSHSSISHSAGVANRRVTTINSKMCLSSLKNVCDVAYFQ